MIALFDYDSAIYHAVYRIVSISDIRNYLESGIDKDTIRKQIIFDAMDRLNNITLKILDSVEATKIKIDSIEYFVTNCKNSIRKKIDTNYKANRKPTSIGKWVSLLRNELISDGVVSWSDEWEADDLIADRASDIPYYGCVIISLDKDLMQIPGVHFNYYKDKESGQMRGLSHTSKLDSFRSLAYQMLTGDSTDNIKGIPKIGIKRANDILGHCKTEYGLFRNVVQAYYEFKDRFEEEPRIELMKNFRLLKLGTK